MPEEGDLILVVNSAGHLRHTVWVVCPDCKEGRYVTESNTRRIPFTGRCHKCHMKIAKRDFYGIGEW